MTNALLLCFYSPFAISAMICGILTKVTNHMGNRRPVECGYNTSDAWRSANSSWHHLYFRQDFLKLLEVKISLRLLEIWMKAIQTDVAITDFIL